MGMNLEATPVHLTDEERAMLQSLVRSLKTEVKRLVHAAAPIDWLLTGQFAGRTGSAGARILVQEMLRGIPAEAKITAEEE